MFLVISIALFTAILFYVVIPVGGAFWVRSGWRSFRRSVLGCSLKKQVKYGEFKSHGDGYLGDYRFVGTLQAIQGDDILWVSNKSISLPVNLSQVSVYTLPHSFLSSTRGGLLSLRHSLPDEVPRRTRWDHIFSLSEGTKILICGGLWRENGQLVLRRSDSQRLMVLIYDGDEGSILPRCVWGGRQRNEYMNSYTPWSIILGALLLLLEAYLFYNNPLASTLGRLTSILAIAPLTVFLPPGIIFFELYRLLWRRGRLFRAERDMLKLPVRFWPGAESLEDCPDIVSPDGFKYRYRRYETGRAGLDDNPRENLLDPAVCNSNEILASECYCFGPVDETGDFIHQDSSLTETVLLPGNPFDLARKSAAMARRMELLSGGAFGLGLVINMVILFLLLNTFLP